MQRSRATSLMSPPRDKGDYMKFESAQDEEIEKEDTVVDEGIEDDEDEENEYEDDEEEESSDEINEEENDKSA